MNRMVKSLAVFQDKNFRYLYTEIFFMVKILIFFFLASAELELP